MEYGGIEDNLYCFLGERKKNKDTNLSFRLR